MLSILLSACLLAALTVAMHATGIVLLRGLIKLRTRRLTSEWLVIRMLLQVIWCLILLHLAEISIWGLVYLWHRCLPDAETAFYFSGITYTTVGYGDVVLAKPWRLLAPVEGLMGVLMFGLSTGYFFVMASHLQQSPPQNAAAGSPAERKEA
jgi:hypothetical protein